MPHGEYQLIPNMRYQLLQFLHVLNLITAKEAELEIYQAQIVSKLHGFLRNWGQQMYYGLGKLMERRYKQFSTKSVAKFSTILEPLKSIIMTIKSLLAKSGRYAMIAQYNE